jgi:hypothetical protein
MLIYVNKLRLVYTRDVGVVFFASDAILQLQYKNSYLLKLPSPAAVTSIYCFLACVNTTLKA